MGEDEQVAEIEQELKRLERESEQDTNALDNILDKFGRKK